jgi:hypothetical protein
MACLFSQFYSRVFTPHDRLMVVANEDLVVVKKTGLSDVTDQALQGVPRDLI